VSTIAAAQGRAAGLQWPPRVLLLAHHGTAGAERALAFALQLAVPGTTRLLHLYVVPDFWAGMQGDDWLNNAWTRDAFADHVEKQLAQEARERMGALSARCATAGVACTPLLRYGRPAECLIAAAREGAADLVVIGPPRPKGEPGLRSRMDLETLARGLAAPLLIAR
jgi:nucleotide-binding universal stress UspA family protein